MLIEQIIEFELRWPGPPGRTCTPTIGCFDDKTKFSLSGLLFITKILHEVIYLTFFYFGQITYKF